MGNPTETAQPRRMRGPGYQIDFRTGQPCLVQFSLNGQKYKCVILGVEPYSFIIARLPLVPGIQNHLRAGNEVVVRLQDGGTVYAFTSEILSFVLKPAPILVFSYPPNVEGLQYREHKRTRCLLPAEVANGFFRTGGLVTDISLGGCRVIADWRDKNKVFNMMTGDQLELGMNLDLGEVSKVTATLMNFKELKRHFTLGLRFHETQRLKSLAHFIGRLEGVWAALEETPGQG